MTAGKDGCARIRSVRSAGFVAFTSGRSRARRTASRRPHCQPPTLSRGACPTAGTGGRVSHARWRSSRRCRTSATASAVIAFGSMPANGKWMVGVVAVVVLAFAELKMLGIRRIRRAGPRLTLRHEAA